MKRTVYGTWSQINYVIQQNNKLKQGSGYDYYEIDQVSEEDLPQSPSDRRSYERDAKTYNFVNFNAMNSPRCIALQDAKRTKQPIEYFRITLYKQ